MRTLQNVTQTAEQLAILLDAGPGFRLIRGAAGSGKTTAALLRLRQLCRSRIERRERQGSTGPVRVLVLTFNQPNVASIHYYAAQAIRESNPRDRRPKTAWPWV